MDPNNSEIVIYRPNQRHELGFFRTWLVMGKNVVKSRELILQLFKRDFIAQYKKSFIGYTWVFISPLFAVISWIFLQMAGMLKPGDVGIPYPAYVLVGSSMWALFIGFFTSASNTLSAGSGFIMLVRYPHESLLFKQTAEQLANFTISFGMNIIVLIFFGVIPSWQIVFFPVVIVPLFFLSSAVGLIVSMVSIVAFDVNKSITMLVNILIFTTPVIYSDKIANPHVKTMIKWNPLTYLVCSARDIIIYGKLYDPVGYAISTAFAALIFLISWRWFYVSENKLIERML